MQGGLGEQGYMERETTLKSYMEEYGNTEVSGVPILLYVIPKRGSPTPKPQGTQQRKAPMKITFDESEPRNVDSDLLSRPDHIIQQDIPLSFLLSH